MESTERGSLSKFRNITYILVIEILLDSILADLGHTNFYYKFMEKTAKILNLTPKGKNSFV